MCRLLVGSIRAFLGGLLFTGATLVQATSYQDWWNNRSLSGMGINVGQQGEQLFVTWFLYDENRNPSFLLFYGPLVNNNTLTASLQRFHGPEPPGYDKNLWSGEVVGTATITFSSSTQGVFSYDYDGKKGSFPIERYAFNPIDLSGYYAGASIYTVTNCGSNDGNYYEPDFFLVKQQGNHILLETVEAGCSYDGAIQQYGTHFTGSGDVYCDSGAGGTWYSPDIHGLEFAMAFRYTVIAKDGCITEGRGGGLK